MSGLAENSTVPRAEFDALKNDIARIKKNPLHDEHMSRSLIAAMDRLAGNIERLTVLFEHANHELHEEYRKGFSDEGVKLDRVIAQNEKIARGILAVADLMQTTGDEGTYPLEEPAQELPAAVPKPKRKDLLDAFS